MLRKGSGESCAPVESESSRNPKKRDYEKGDLDRALDHALEQTFPASDPLSTVPGLSEDEEEAPAA
jgi:hypothetical protein